MRSSVRITQERWDTPKRFPQISMTADFTSSKLEQIYSTISFQRKYSFRKITVRRAPTCYPNNRGQHNRANSGALKSSYFKRRNAIKTRNPLESNMVHISRLLSKIGAVLTYRGYPVLRFSRGWPLKSAFPPRPDNRAPAHTQPLFSRHHYAPPYPLQPTRASLPTPYPR